MVTAARFEQNKLWIEKIKRETSWKRLDARPISSYCEHKAIFKNERLSLIAVIQMHSNFEIKAFPFIEGILSSLFLSLIPILNNLFEFSRQI